MPSVALSSAASISGNSEARHDFEHRTKGPAPAFIAFAMAPHVLLSLSTRKSVRLLSPNSVSYFQH